MRVLRLAELTLERGSLSHEQSTPPIDDPSWAWTRSTIAHLLDTGFNDGPAQIPFELRGSAWSLLKPLTDDPDPTVDSEERYGTNNMDPTSLAINTIRGTALGAVIKYAVWVHRNLKSDSYSDSWNEATGFDRMPGVRDVLNRHLDRTVEPSYAVHSVYGRWFPWLGLVDETWTEQHVLNIFPLDYSSFLYWEAAWDAYISYCQPYDASLVLLKDEYQLAVTRLDSASTDRKHPLHSHENLATHLMVYYLRGRLDLDGALLASFFAEAVPELRAVALRFTGRSFYHLDDRIPKPLEPPPSKDVIGRAMALWNGRMEVAEAAADPTGYAQEVAQFGWWFIAPAFDADWLLRQLISALRLAGHVESGHLVIRRLGELVSSRPYPVLTALELMTMGEYDDWLVLEEASVMQLLASALASPDGAVREQAEQVTHALGARGHRQFRVLLKPRS